jgi:ABC-type phosphate/phosphonate transport system ATPase subunit
MQKPSLILADEPVASLDPKLSREVLGILTKSL